MPWHDIHCCFTGDAAFDVARHFIMRWNKHIKETEVEIESTKGKEFSRSGQGKETSDAHLMPDSSTLRKRTAAMSTFRFPQALPGSNGGAGYAVSCQMLRSVASLSLEYLTQSYA